MNYIGNCIKQVGDQYVFVFGLPSAQRRQGQKGLFALAASANYQRLPNQLVSVLTALLPVWGVGGDSVSLTFHSLF